MDMKAKEIYADAGITAPTFYLHYRSAGKAMISFERGLVNELRGIVPNDIKRDAFYALLTSYVAKNRQYFQAAAKGGSRYLLHKIVTSYRGSLVGDKISERAFRQYVGAVVVTINCWLEFDRITSETAEACAKELMRIRPIRW